MQLWPSFGQTNRESQSKGFPLQEAYIGLEWPGSCSLAVLSHDLEAAQAESDFKVKLWQIMKGQGLEAGR